MQTFYLTIRTAIKLMLGRGVHTSYSQDAEDLLVASFLKKDTGIYVDVGAYHPFLYSNTYGFYRRGWKGIVIDPNRSLRTLYKFFRPRDKFISAGVGKENLDAKYHIFSDGAYNTFSIDEARSREANPYLRAIRTEQIPIRPLKDIVAETGITTIDFLSIDVEGLELEVLESHNWSITPTIVAIEDNAFNPDRPNDSLVYQLLIDKGYRLVAVAPRTPIFMITDAE